ncbi:MAG: rhomboid family intramembrane serine protease [Weeksellaceae bacterium]|jgi:membrane associated rhomboid family serine protease|nr:rhomboid family intramembrane serine protease [Weeksellaceae bacterium]MDX9705179.1 rhomboid family intramembrane serine protease [Weeksellaceae bacterium]
MSLITILIIAITVIFSYSAFNNYNLFDRYKFQPQAILQGKQYDRLLTSGFLHVDMTHLLFNMLTLYFFADVIIGFFAGTLGGLANGSIGFAVVYLIAIVGGNLLALVFQKNNPRYSAVGASGGVSGILFATIIIYPELQLYLFFAIPIKAWFFAIMYLAYSVYGVKKQLGNIGHEAHLGGAIVGLAAPLIFRPELITESQIQIIGISVPLLGVLLIPIIVLFVMALKTNK